MEHRRCRTEGSACSKSNRGQSSSSAVSIRTGFPATLMYTQHFVNSTDIPACSAPDPAIFPLCSDRSLQSVMFRADSMNTNIINTYTHAHSHLTALPYLNDAFIATAIQTEYQRSFNTQTLNYSHVTQTRHHISDTGCTQISAQLCGHRQKTSLAVQMQSFNPLALELDIYSLAHHLCKM